ncbi:FadR/GntR family transcriptional regulator [Sphingopyxis granuli]|jgi:DNA-binding FadR family transcriptional regulator|uniref:FadR/GntR family transcriptional regulator n=1 Tax=Sphingopyxis granuli TaxID=267128 RepID=UPI001BAEAFF8|nr:FCD domain-containing protein [Sphingopyxis granuli]
MMDASPANETLANRTARALVSLSLAADPGDFLGAEDDLLGRFGVSRPTLRQAAKMVERERLISVRRGTRGGFFAERPDARDAIQSLARFLRIRGASLGDVIQVTRPVSEEAAAAAAQRRTAEDIGRLQAFVATIEARDTARDLIAAEVEMARLVARMCGNPVVELVMEIGYSFGLDERGSDLYADPGRRERTRAMQRSLCQAIIDGDEEIARLMMRRRSEQFDAWLHAGTAIGKGRV